MSELQVARETINKVDKETNAPLAGAVLIVKKNNQEIKSTYTSFFKNMKPVVNGCEAKFNNKIIYSSFV